MTTEAVETHSPGPKQPGLIVKFTALNSVAMKIYEITQITDVVVAAYKKLIPQLAPGVPVPDKERLEEIIGSGNTKIFVAGEKEVTGTLTLVLQLTPTGPKAWIEDVVVDASARGKGIGEKLIQAAVDYAIKIGVNKIDLTSGHNRLAANRLYQKMGFERRETHVYRLTVKNNN